MSFYRNTFYRSDKTKSSPSVEKHSNTLGRWKKEVELSKKDNIKTRLTVRDTKSGLNKKVVKATSRFPDGTRLISRLVERPTKNKKR